MYFKNSWLVSCWKVWLLIAGFGFFILLGGHYERRETQRLGSITEEEKTAAEQEVMNFITQRIENVRLSGTTYTYEHFDADIEQVHKIEEEFGFRPDYFLKQVDKLAALTALHDSGFRKRYNAVKENREKILRFAPLNLDKDQKFIEPLSSGWAAVYEGVGILFCLPSILLILLLVYVGMRLSAQWTYIHGKAAGAIASMLAFLSWTPGMVSKAKAQQFLPFSVKTTSVQKEKGKTKEEQEKDKNKSLSADFRWWACKEEDGESKWRVDQTVFVNASYKDLLLNFWYFQTGSFEWTELGLGHRLTSFGPLNFSLLGFWKQTNQGDSLLGPELDIFIPFSDRLTLFNDITHYWNLKGGKPRELETFHDLEFRFAEKWILGAEALFVKPERSPLFFYVGPEIGYDIRDGTRLEMFAPRKFLGGKDLGQGIEVRVVFSW